MKRHIFNITACLIIPALMSCQSIYKAQKQMDKYNYADAIEILKKTSEKEKTHSASIPMLAECYRMQHDILNTKSTYAEAVTLPDAKAETFYYYAKALQATGDYEKAREMFQKYAEKNPSDPKGSLYVAHCDSVLGPWKNITSGFEVKPVDKINTIQSEFGPAFYNGELIFASDFNDNEGGGKQYGWTGHGYLNFMKSKPEINDDFWGNMEPATAFDSKFNQPYHDGPATFSSDGNSIYFTRSFIGKAKREGIYKTNLLKIYYATKINGQWSEIMAFYLNSKDYSVGHPSLSTDGQTLYFVSDMPGGLGGTDIWMCKREGETWGPAKNLGKTINTSESEMFPTITNDGILYFASDGQPGYGSFDIFKTKNENGEWTTPVNLHSPINGSFDDFAIAFFSGETNGFFSSNRPGGMGSDDIYAFRVAVPVLPTFISGFVKDKITMQPIAGATVFLYNPSSGSVKVAKTGIDGMYKVMVDKPEEYVVKAMKSHYIADCMLFPLASISTGNINIAPRDLLLDKLTISKTFKIDNIYYNFDKYNIREDAKPELDKLVRIMNENPVNVELGSHTDSRGSSAYNDKLSQKRAESVVKYITNNGIDKSRITAQGYGEQQLVNKCAEGVPCTIAEHQANRRTEFKVTNVTVPADSPDQFNAENYFEGQDLNSKMLPTDFFMNCK